MRALVCTAKQERPAEIREVAEPEPSANQAVVAVRAVGINRGELRLLGMRPDGWRPGQDIAGVVVRAAADGTGPREGDRVVALVDQEGWAERAAASTSRLAALPASVSFPQAAALPVAGLTALRALRVGGSLLGRRVLITGASGGVGHFAIQLAARAGARVTALVSRPERASFATELGADEVVVGPAGLIGQFDVTLESVGGAVLAAAVQHNAEDGTVVMFGNSSGEPTPLSFRDFASARSRLYAFRVYASGEPPAFGEDLGTMAAFIAAGGLKPHIGFEGAWRDPLPALAALQDREFSGKAVLSLE